MHPISASSAIIFNIHMIHDVFEWVSVWDCSVTSHRWCWNTGPVCCCAVTVYPPKCILKHLYTLHALMDRTVCNDFWTFKKGYPYLGYYLPVFSSIQWSSSMGDVGEGWRRSRHGLYLYLNLRSGSFFCIKGVVVYGRQELWVCLSAGCFLSPNPRRSAKCELNLVSVSSLQRLTKSIRRV